MFRTDPAVTSAVPQAAPSRWPGAGAVSAGVCVQPARYANR
jgi:hypothetical protein